VLPFKLLFDQAFTVDLGDHVFPAQKYSLVCEHLVASGTATEDDFVIPAAATDDDVRRVHTAQYVKKLKTGRLSVQEQRILEVPWSSRLVEAAWLAAGAAIEAGRLALRDGCAIVIGGGFHHAFPDHGEGFCIVHDVAIAIAALRASNEVKRVGVIDLDVHQGNGTGAILGTDPEAFTMSIHQEQNYPAEKPSNHLDVGLTDDTGDEPYLAALDVAMAPVFSFAPELLFYLAGADPYQHDQLGGLSLTVKGLLERDRRVFSAARQARVPIAVTLAGGYALNTADTVAIHANTVAAAAAVFGAPHHRS